MQFISLKPNALTYFNAAAPMSEMSGSSKYIVSDSEICEREKKKQSKIESQSAITDYLNVLSDTHTAHKVIERLKINYEILLQICISAAFNEIEERARLDNLDNEIKLIKYLGESEYIKYKTQLQLAKDKVSGYYINPVLKKGYNQINKTKVRGKMYALFNLKCSRKFVAFYSVSFPTGTIDDKCFECWNYWLTKCRKYFNLTNYVWVTERQKNNTLHFHMITNNYLPILQVNRAMAVIINNQVQNDSMSWKNSSIDKYNGVDVDSIYNSKRHKKTGKNMNPSEIRNWLSKYITKYVTKNTEKFEHLCWHCSRSVSILFTSEIFPKSKSKEIESKLPTFENLYYTISAGFFSVKVFLFVPPPELFVKIKLYNDLIFGEFVPEQIKRTNIINYKSINI